MHKPVHSHSHNPDSTSDGEATPAPEPPSGPFSVSAENGYRPASRVSVPNPYTTRKIEVDDVDAGADPVTRWRGVGLDEPEPRSKPAPATTDTMTDNPASFERTERPSAPVSPPAPEAVEQRTAPQDRPRPESVPGVHGQAPSEIDPQRSQAQWSQEAPMPEQRPEADRNQEHHTPPSYTDPASPGQWAPENPVYQRPPQAPTAGHAPYAQPQQPFGGHTPQEAPRQGPGHQAPGQGQAAYGYQGHPGQYGYQGHSGHHEPGPYQRPSHEGYAPPAYPQGHQGYPRADHPVMPHYPMPQPPPYPQPMVAYQGAYPAPYQPPGYVLPGQPVVYPGQQFHPYGQPVQHVIVLAAGQQPQVISAESVATLFAERAETTTSEEVRPSKELTHSEPEPEEDTEPATEPVEAEESSTETPPVEEPAPVAEDEPATDTAGPKISATVSEALGGAQGDLLNEALAGLAMRDLSLVDALLEMVEELETDAKDPDLLDKLFQIDNFATRMRRNGENLLVLTGHDGGESDAHDEIVPLLDVTRAATSEIKDYPRVSLGKIPPRSITGLAADDISHLLAELLDNATANSPEHSQVVISAQELDDGRLMIIVEDEGVGMPEAQLAELNGRLSCEPVLDDNVPKHMGLYVASRIARKHGLETRLEARSFRGISAYTIIPENLLRTATPRQPGQKRTVTISSASAPVKSTGPIPSRPTNNNVAKDPGHVESPKKSTGGSAAVTAAGLPRRSATPHGSPLRMVRNPGALSDTPPPKREDTPPRLTGEARAEQIRDEIGDFLDGERAALEGEDLEGDKE